MSATTSSWTRAASASCLGAGPARRWSPTIRRIRSRSTSASSRAFPLARSVDAVDGGVNGRTAQPIVETSPKCWAETDLTSLAGGRGLARREAGRQGRTGTLDRRGGVRAATPPPPPPKPGEARHPTRRSRRPASSSSATPTSPPTTGSGRRAIATCSSTPSNWVAQQENLIAIRPKEGGDRRVTMSAEDQQRTLLYLVGAGRAGIVLAAGVWTWRRRR